MCRPCIEPHPALGCDQAHPPGDEGLTRQPAPSIWGAPPLCISSSSAFRQPGPSEGHPGAERRMPRALSGLAFLGCALALAIGCDRDPVGPTPRFGRWTDDGIFRYCRMLPSGNGHASMFTTNWLGVPCPVQPNPTPQGAFFGSANPDSIVFNFNGTALDIRGKLFCSDCPTTIRYTLYDTNGVAFEDQPVLLEGNGDISFEREDRRPCTTRKPARWR